MADLRYGFERRFAGMTFEQAVQGITAALKGEGFGVLMEIDIKETLKKKLGVDFRRYLILGACNPALSHKALEVEAQIGLLLPCNIVVQEMQNGEVLVSIADPRVMFTVVEKPALAPIAEEARARLQRVIHALA